MIISLPKKVMKFNFSLNFSWLIRFTQPNQERNSSQGNSVTKKDKIQEICNTSKQVKSDRLNEYCKDSEDGKSVTKRALYSQIGVKNFAKIILKTGWNHLCGATKRPSQLLRITFLFSVSHVLNANNEREQYPVLLSEWAWSLAHINYQCQFGHVGNAYSPLTCVRNLSFLRQKILK